MCKFIFCYKSHGLQMFLLPPECQAELNPKPSKMNPVNI